MAFDMNQIRKGNIALKEKRYEDAISIYIEHIIKNKKITQTIDFNISLAKKLYLDERKNRKEIKIGICGWELSHNAAGRAYTLAKVYQRFNKSVEIIGNLQRDSEIWDPIKNSTIKTKTIYFKKWDEFLEKAIHLVIKNPYDLVHLSKPRAPNIIYGILYKKIWNSIVIMDIDDEELAFIGENEQSLPLSVFNEKNFPKLDSLSGKEWTQIAVGLASIFDEITVSNRALKEVYGGQIIKHARDEKEYSPSEQRRKKNRKLFSIPNEKKVILFFGTPRVHKGLLEISDAISKTNRKDLLFVIAGNFLDSELKKSLLERKEVDYLFIENQPVNAVPDIVSIADLCILPQNISSTAAQFQLPAKLGDALAMAIPVISTKTSALIDEITSNAIITVNKKEELPSAINDLLDNKDKFIKQQKISRSFFEKEWSIEKNSFYLLNLIKKIKDKKLDINAYLLCDLIKEEALNNIIKLPE